MTRKDDPLAMEKMNAWLEAVNTELHIDPELINTYKKPLLNLISSVAHGPSRPGAPLTAFLVGYLAGTGGDTLDAINHLEELAAKFPTAN